MLTHLVWRSGVVIWVIYLFYPFLYFVLFILQLYCETNLPLRPKKIQKPFVLINFLKFDLFNEEMTVRRRSHIYEIPLKKRFRQFSENGVDYNRFFLHTILIFSRATINKRRHTYIAEYMIASFGRVTIGKGYAYLKYIIFAYQICFSIIIGMSR